MFFMFSSTSIIFRSFMFSVSKYYKKQSYYQRTTEEETSSDDTVLSTNLFDEYGDIPSIKEAYNQITKAKQIVVLRTINSTIIGYQLDSSANTRLEYSIGCKSFYMLQSPRHHILITGVIPDCRSVVRYTKQIVLNHTIEYASLPSGYYIAQRLSEYLQSSSISSSRPLACHTFIIDSGYNTDKIYLYPNKTSVNSNETTSYGNSTTIELSSNLIDNNNSNDLSNLDFEKIFHSKIMTMGKIYEVSAVGAYCEILSGSGGNHMIEGKKILQKEYTLETFLSLNKSLTLLNKIFNHTNNVNDDREENIDLSSSITSHINTIYQYLILPDLYID